MSLSDLPGLLAALLIGIIGLFLALCLGRTIDCDSGCRSRESFIGSVESLPDLADRYLSEENDYLDNRNPYKINIEATCTVNEALTTLALLAAIFLFVGATAVRIGSPRNLRRGVVSAALVHLLIVAMIGIAVPPSDRVEVIVVILVLGVIPCCLGWLGGYLAKRLA